jgi:hypothetical protein
MNLIDRYVFAVTEHLSDNNRKDVADELRSNIEDMLPDSPTDRDIRGVLEKMGNPRKLANEFYPTKRYLIGPNLFDSYISLLKLVIGITVSVMLGVTILGWVVSFPDNSNYVSLITDLIANAIGAAVQAAVWVTIIYAVLERTGVSEGQMPFSKKEWTVDDLPTGVVPPSKKISRAETGLSLFFTLLFVSVLYFNPNLIAIYIHENRSTEIIPLFSEERLAIYLVAILLITLLQLIIIVWKFIQSKWNLPLAIANTVQNIASSVLIIFLLCDRQLINQNFFKGIADLANTSANQIIDSWYRGTSIVVIVVFIVIAAWDSISAFSKAKK